MSDLFVDNIKHQSSQGSGTITLGTSGETIALASGAEVSGFTGQNYPAFHAKKNADQSISASTETKITYTVEVIDTDSAYDTSTSTFTVPTGKGGKYFIYAASRLNGTTDQDIYDLSIRVNGTKKLQFSANQFRFTSNQTSGILELDAADEVDVIVYIGAAFDVRNSQINCFFGGYRLGA